MHLYYIKDFSLNSIHILSLLCPLVSVSPARTAASNDPDRVPQVQLVSNQTHRLQRYQQLCTDTKNMHGSSIIVGFQETSRNCRSMKLLYFCTFVKANESSLFPYGLTPHSSIIAMVLNHIWVCWNPNKISSFFHQPSFKGLMSATGLAK